MIRATIRKRATGPVRDVLAEAVESDLQTREPKLTSKGIMLFGPKGTVSTHFTSSDHRVAKNLAADLRRVGILPTQRTSV